MRDRRRYCKTLVSALISLTAVASQGLALDPRQPRSDYLRKAFTIEDGLPANEVHAIVQTANGFLWVATDGGLSRFDGEHFALIRLRGGSQEIPVLSLLVTPDGDLWAGTDAGLVRVPRAALDHYDRSLVKLFHIGKGLRDQVQCIHFSRKGTLWVGTSGGLYKFDQGNFVTVIAQDMVSRIEEDSDGALLIVTGHGFVELDGVRITPHPEFAEQLGVATNEVFHVFPDHHGVTWFCTSKGVARRVNGSLEKLAPYGLPKSGAWRAYEDPQGNVWIHARQGLFRADAAGLHAEATDLEPRSMYADRNGELWIGDGSQALVRLKNRSIRMYTAADGLPGDAVNTVLVGHDGTLWTGNNCGGLSRFDGRRFRNYNEKDGLTNSCVCALAEDNNHDLWIGTWGGGVYRFHEGRFTQYAERQGLPSVIVRSLVAARDGSLWIATFAGLTHMQNGRLRNYTVADGLSSDRIMTMYEDRHGTIWAGTSTGVDRLAGERFVPVPRDPELGDLPFSTLSEDSLGDLYAFSWVNGISRLENDRFVKVSETLEFASMVEARGGDLWFSGRQGVSRVASGDFKHAEQDRDSPLDYTSFGRADGLNSKECSWGQPNMAMTPDGNLWVATVKGLAMLDLQRLGRSNRKPAIFMNELDVGRAKMVPGRESVLPAGTYHVVFHFTAIDLASPENVRLQYRLDGVDPLWLDADSTRTAIYTSIPVNAHSFHIRATNSDGVWDRAGIVYNVTQQPFFYQTNLFQLAVLLVVGLLAAAVYRRRVRHIATEVNARFDERLAERMRLARDIHDTLLQTIQGSKMVADVALGEPADAIQMSKALERLSGWLGQAIQEARSALNSLRSSATEGNDLAEALQRAAEECRFQRSIDVALAAEGAALEMHPIFRDEVYRIGYEAIRNACVHSEGSHLKVEVSYVEDLTVRVRDNGKGMDADVAAKGKRGHFRFDRDVRAGRAGQRQINDLELARRGYRGGTRGSTQDRVSATKPWPTEPSRKDPTAFLAGSRAHGTREECTII